MSRPFALALSALFMLGSCGTEAGFAQDSSRSPSTRRAPPPASGQAVAIFAGGCFWCMEGPFEALEGVSAVLSGYAGGQLEGPSYREVSSGRTHHLEAIQVSYDPSRVSYARLLEVYWHNIDPTQDDGQFCDHGRQYRTAIFVSTPEERRLAEASKARMAEALGRPITTEIRAAAPFWIAEDYHQDYHRTHPTSYHRYRTGCGRDARLRELWGASAGH